MKVCLVYVSCEGPGWASYCASAGPEAVMLPHGLMVFASWLRRSGHEPVMTDMRSYVHQGNFEATAHGLDADLFLFWVQWGNLATARWVVECLRRVGKAQPIVMAGPAVSAGRFRDFPGSNAALFGEPEVGFDKVAEKAFAATPEAPDVVDVLGTPFPDLDQLPDPDTGVANSAFEKGCSFFPLIKPPIYTMTIGRSCPACYDSVLLGSGFECVQCNPEDPFATNRLRPRLKSPEKVVDDVYRLATSHGTGGIGSIVFHDSHLASAGWVEGFIKEWHGLVRRMPMFFPLAPEAIQENPIIVREMAKLGMIMTSLNVGSFIDRTRAVLGIPRSIATDKYAISIVQGNRVNLSLAYQVGCPTETETDTDEMEKELRLHQVHHHHSRYFRPLPGHRSFVFCLQKNLLTGVRPGDCSELPVPCLKGVDHARTMRRMIQWRIAHAAAPIIIPWESALTSPLEITPTPKVPKFHGPVEPGKPAPDPDRVRKVHEQSDLILQKSWPVKVSCVLLSYNRPDYLREAFHSLENQTLSKDKFEVILVENGSTHPRVHEFVNYKDNPTAFPWVKVIRHTHNVNNVATAWNEALTIASGKYFCMLDDDNLKRPDFMEKLSNYLDNNPDKDGVHCRSLVIDKQGHPRGERGRTGNFTLEKELEGNYVDSGELMFRKEATVRIGNFDERCKACEDWDFVCRLVHFGKGLGFLDEVLAEYRAHDANRLHTSIELGAAACTELLRSKHKKKEKLDVKVIVPPMAELTQSQKQVINGIGEALHKIPFLSLPSYGHDDFNCDILLIVAPFRLGQPAIDNIRKRTDEVQPRPQVVMLHMEDPQAISPNERFLGWADWIVSNDINAMDHYRHKLRTQNDLTRERQVLCWNSLGVSESAKSVIAEASGERPYDVVFLGYPYPSRARFVREFVKGMPTTWKCIAIGDGWDQQLSGFPKVEKKPTLTEKDSIRVLCQSKVCVVTHRSGEDAGGFPGVKPGSVHRGFIEAACGCAVILDNDRTFGHGRVKLDHAKDAQDAVKKAWAILKTPAELQESQIENARNALEDCSVTTRLTKIFNAVRSQHWNRWIP